MSRVYLSALFTAFTMISLPSNSQAEDNFRAMVADAKLSGWVRTNTPAETWKYEDGVLYCTGKPIGEIRTAKMYQNFIMEVEWRHMVPRGNAGIFVWADDITARGVPFHRGIEVQVLENAYGNNRSHTTHGDIFPIHGATMTPINGRGGSRAFPTESRSKPSPEWNHYRIECRDGEISLAVNGKVVTRGKECVPSKGYICLESEGGVVEYRNLRIQELPDSPIDDSHVAIANRGYRSMYTGLNLEGWKAPQSPDAWQVNDWRLVHRGSETQTDTLESTQSFGSTQFVVDVQLQDESAHAVIQAGPDIHIDLKDQRIAQHLEKSGRWNRLETIQGDESWFIEVNGHRVKVDGPFRNAMAPLKLITTGNVQFANIYVKE